MRPFQKKSCLSSAKANKFSNGGWWPNPTQLEIYPFVFLIFKIFSARFYSFFQNSEIASKTVI